MDTYDILLYVSYLLIAIGLVVAIIMPLINSMDNPRSLLKTVVGIIGIVILFFIAYSISSNEVLPKFEADPFYLTPASSQVVGGILITTYFLFLFAIIGIVFTEINKIVR
jgi:NADH:ubiquinone oxidoreductase subunit 6 (subunit J)